MNFKLRKPRQLTFLVTAKTEEEKQMYLDSNLCLIRSWKHGWFDIPENMREEFVNCFGKHGIEHSSCRSDITKSEIHIYNRSRR